MSLDKAIEHGKEHRKPYRGSKAIDPTCRNHGGCKWCEENRTFSDKKREPVSEDIETYRPVIYGTLDYMTGELQIEDWTREEDQNEQCESSESLSGEERMHRNNEGEVWR